MKQVVQNYNNGELWLETYPHRSAPAAACSSARDTRW